MQAEELQPMAQRYNEHRSPLRVKSKTFSSDNESKDHSSAKELDFVNKRESHTTTATTTANLESDIISRSTQKFSQATNSLKEMQKAVLAAQSQIEKASRSPLRQRSSTPRYMPAERIIEEENADMEASLGQDNNAYM